MKNLFHKYQPLKSKAWLRNIPKEDRRVFAQLGYSALGNKRGFYYLHSVGGKAASKRTPRDKRGRYLKVA